MSSYGRLFKEETAKALGLGHGRPTIDPEEASQAYREDPAAAFTRAAAAFQPPGDSIPIPFVTEVADDNPLARTPRPA